MDEYRLRDNEEIVLAWYDSLLTKESIGKHFDRNMWSVYNKGKNVLNSSIDTYALQSFVNYARRDKENIV